jgi:DNA-binding GntR family transcriptional regulator
MRSRRRSALVDMLVADQPGRPQQAILEELRRVILDGAVAPGTPIPLAEVADLFGVSKIPVRESLKTLIGEGLIAHRGNSGYTVAQLTPQELREMYIVRETLESASLAAAVANATDEDRAAIVAVNEVLQQAIRDDDTLTYHRQSRLFHIALTRPSRMHRLLHMLESAWNVTEPVQSMVHVAPSDRAQLHSDHCHMLDAFLAGDVAQLLTASQLHAQRLNSVIATLPTDTGLLVSPDISGSPDVHVDRGACGMGRGW